jgi:hypothetical protein
MTGGRALYFNTGRYQCQLGNSVSALQAGGRRSSATGHSTGHDSGEAMYNANRSFFRDQKLPLVDRPVLSRLTQNLPPSL